MTVDITLSNINLIGTNNQHILKNINLNINKGDFVIIKGHNGAGKTTLFKIINGLINPTNGTLKIFNKEINNKTKKKIGYIPQINNFENSLPVTVKQVIEIGITAKNGIFKSSSNKDKELIPTISKNLDIEHLLNTPIGNLSGGEMQKVSIARVLAQESDIILFDEPLSHLDTKSQNNILKILENINLEKKTTILIILHNLEQIPECCSKIITMENGEIIKQQTVN
ncbi:MAG: ATP-binding cassette domain-containing protein [Endomicrobiaceae bacterium]|nr:ATP-binding cassette domain-containing protein [Endomicrobiaceae bacterium]